MVFDETSLFTRLPRDHLDGEEYHGLQAHLIEHPDAGAVIRKILTYLGLRVPQSAAGRGLGPPAPNLPGPAAPILTYHAVPDIA
jgi:hypothetical protein